MGPRYNTPWECHDGSFAVHEELRWQDGPGPTYSRDAANELLENRYSVLAKGDSDNRRNASVLRGFSDYGNGTSCIWLA